MSIVTTRCLFLLLTAATKSLAHQCGDGYYYDEVLHRCEDCAAICYLAKVQGTTEDCEVFCPDYQHQNNPVIADCTTEQGQESRTVDDGEDNAHQVLLVPIFIGVCICVLVCVAVLIIYFRETRNKHACAKRHYSCPDRTYVKVDLRREEEGDFPESPPPSYPGPRSI